jgi:UDP-GlcNAc:undecaprenyl-phosphate GlcNAc-1-phosphate transferase
MNTIMTIFCLSLGLAFLLTPAAGRVARYYQLVDPPSQRKVHKQPIPRIGGVAIYLAVFLPFLVFMVHRYQSTLLDQFYVTPSLLWALAGATLVFLMGLMDDIYRLRPWVKLAVQVVAAVLAYLGGIRIAQMELPWGSAWSMGWLSLPVTVLWFLLVVNAINLIDGLDGLAAGISLFVSLVMLALCIMGDRFLVATGLAAVAGACLGFLRYNFNPASIFMGDCGSYLLGYLLAALTVLGSIKSQATVTILIPIIALGLPLMDTLLAPVRRFLVGQELFKPDKSHIHHRLMKLGLTQRNAVLLMYGATILLGVCALGMVHVRDTRAGLILVLLAAIMILGIRRLGYLEYLGVGKMIGYFHDVTDEMGFNKERRTFLNHQIVISQTHDPSEMWDRVTDALQLLRIDQAEMQFNGVRFPVPDHGRWGYGSCADGQDQGECHHQVFSLDLPLLDERKSYGTLHLKKNLLLDPVNHYTLRRIEHLRRTVVRKLHAFEEEAARG